MSTETIKILMNLQRYRIRLNFLKLLNFWVIGFESYWKTVSLRPWLELIGNIDVSVLYLTH